MGERPAARTHESNSAELRRADAGLVQTQPRKVSAPMGSTSSTRLLIAFSKLPALFGSNTPWAVVGGRWMFDCFLGGHP